MQDSERKDESKKKISQKIQHYFPALSHHGLWLMNYPIPLSRKEIVRVFQKKLPAYFSRDEVNTILNSNTHDPRAHLVINTLWKTGIRVSELCALRKRDLDPYGKCIRVIILKQGIKHERKSGPGRRRKPRKVSRQTERIIPISDDLVAELMAFLHTTGNREKSNSLDDPIFPWSRMTIHRIVKKACKRAGFNDDRAHPHTFRHSYAVHLIRNQVPITIVKELLGHSNIASTLVYLRIVQPDKEIILNQVEW